MRLLPVSLFLSTSRAATLSIPLPARACSRAWVPPTREQLPADGAIAVPTNARVVVVYASVYACLS